jgi:hypothetical protein
VKILYLALAGGSPDHDSHQKSQEETWAQNQEPGVRVIWMHGDENLVNPRIDGNNLYLPVQEQYEKLLEKTILAVNWALENIEFDYLIRTNTSNYFYQPLVRKHLSKFLKTENTAGGVIASWRGLIQGVKKNHSYISGAGIYLSRASTQLLRSMNAKEYTGVPDDVAIGHWLSLNGTKFRPIPRNNVTDFKPIWPSPQIRVKSWKHPEVTCDRMFELDRIYKAATADEIFSSVEDFVSHEKNRCELELSLIHI